MMFSGGELDAFFGRRFLVFALVAMAIGAALAFGGYFGIGWVLQHVRIA